MNYKITNLRNGNIMFLNKEEKQRYFLKNCYQINYITQYKIENMTELQRIRKNKILDIIAIFCTLAAFLLLTIIHIQTNY